ncbi:protein-glutamate O-methyltransferase CheR [Pseudomaricurvus alkylphenolicus]|uniref:CheR family methyltransferase n=1 Tax=Pseudomaricurvus alkylphenolicus TaxID=1306991 RepID=UPI001423BD42|nr:protein-glutamate O-methyltransferase CheR [Pseudomaricurvus alkylphenolicus]NIB43261.1 protein-glutamate O-methyltransferase CheR [Pseudomaricurvus alkylphenolicus]
MSLTGLSPGRLQGQQKALAPDEFESFRLFLQEACGIFLAENKQYLVSTRIRKILEDNNLDSLTSLVEQMRRNRHSKLRDKVIDAMTTNETFWFRDTYPYEHLKNTLLPELQKSGSGPLRIWSAACSSGQEPYSISMSVEEYRRINMGVLPRQVEVVATDLSTSMLDQARAGEYDKMSVMRGLSRERLDAFFDRLPGDNWRVKPVIRDRVQFRPMNLLDPYITLGRFDVIFCRNVLIYFSGDLKSDILRRLHGALKPGGMLVLGSSEGLAMAADMFEMVHCNPGIIYRAR